MPRDPADVAAGWLRWAAEDLTLAEHIANDAEVVPRGACVFAQQAAEKALKALLAARGIDPPRLHDLDRMAARLPEGEDVLFDAIDLPELTRWAIEVRYPDDLGDATVADAERAVDLARQVIAVVRVVLEG